ncbi:hypothetical protein GCM10027577_08790 [Spirosoma fluminis]
MAIVLYLSKRKLPLRVKQLFQSADLGLMSITIPAFVAVEISFLAANGRIDVSLADLRHHVNQYPSYQFEPLTMDVIEASLSMTDIPELHDRLVMCKKAPKRYMRDYTNTPNGSNELQTFVMLHT